MNMIVDCHVNIWNPDQLTQLWRGQMARMRPDATPGVLADANTLLEAMGSVWNAIVFPIRYGKGVKYGPIYNGVPLCSERLRQLCYWSA